MRLCWTPVLVALIAGTTPLVAQHERPAIQTNYTVPGLAYQGRLLEKNLPVTGVRTLSLIHISEPTRPY